MGQQLVSSNQPPSLMRRTSKGNLGRVTTTLLFCNCFLFSTRRLISYGDKPMTSESDFNCFSFFQLFFILPLWKNRDSLKNRRRQRLVLHDTTSLSRHSCVRKEGRKEETTNVLLRKWKWNRLGWVGPLLLVSQQRQRQQQLCMSLVLEAKTLRIFQDQLSNGLFRPNHPQPSKWLRYDSNEVRLSVDNSYPRKKKVWGFPLSDREWVSRKKSRTVVAIFFFAKVTSILSAS